MEQAPSVEYPGTEKGDFFLFHMDAYVQHAFFNSHFSHNNLLFTNNNNSSSSNTKSSTISILVYRHLIDPFGEKNGEFD